MKDLKVQSTNEVNIMGKLLSTTFREGNTKKDNKPYESCDYVVRVTQVIEGQEQINEITGNVFAVKYTKQNKINPAYKTIQDMKQMRTIQNDGEDHASVIKINKANLVENTFVSQSGQVVSGWKVRSSYANEGGMGEYATFIIDIYILNMFDEVIQDEPTGRLIIRGGIVQWGEKLDVVDFVVEDPTKIQYISQNWSINDTVTVKGRIRCTAQTTQATTQKSSWGEEIPETTTRMTRELVIVNGSDFPFDEDYAYDSEEIQRGFNERKAMIEQLQLEAKSKANNKKSASAPAQGQPQAASRPKFEWE